MHWVNKKNVKFWSGGQAAQSSLEEKIEKLERQLSVRPNKEEATHKEDFQSLEDIVGSGNNPEDFDWIHLYVIIE